MIKSFKVIVTGLWFDHAKSFEENSQVQTFLFILWFKLTQNMNPQIHFYDPEDKKKDSVIKCFQFKLVKLAQTNM